ncbi:MAG TPA: magnesium transporter CorA family protein [Pirellulaceae bacterium]|nr:magnesium transporter CorA family protein [Pirellulaceae bacterium]
MQATYAIRDGSLVPEETGNVWIAWNPTEAETRTIREKCEIDEYDMNSALDADEVPRLEVDSDSYTIIWKVPTQAQPTQTSLFAVTSLGLFFNKNRLVLIGSQEISLMERKHQRRIESLEDIVLYLLFHTVHHFQGHLKVIKSISTELEQKINQSMDNQHLLQMFSLGESLIYYQSAISGNGSVLNKLQSFVLKSGLFARRGELFEDLTIDNAQCLKIAEIYSHVLSGLMDARGTIVNNNMNVLIKNLTIINVIFLPLNLIASVGGMSEFSMMTQGVHWTIAYTIFMLVMVIVAVLTYLALKYVNLDGWPSAWKLRLRTRK